MNEETFLVLGAESKIIRITRLNQSFVLKIRPKKPYLLPEIDDLLRSSRTARECKTLTIARTLGIPTPTVHSINLKTHTIMMDYIEGQTLKDVLKEAGKDEIRRLCTRFGEIVALLHNGDVVHGDPTSSNVIVGTDSKLWMIDFGLAEFNATVEMKGVDLHLIRRAFETTHWDNQEIMLSATIKGYSDVLGSKTSTILKRMEEIRERGRYH
ncbi:MAG: KEOPS complex kinase/ATPase Bud32 [Candidatus Thorarchaeota archaeon]